MTNKNNISSQTNDISLSHDNAIPKIELLNTKNLEDREITQELAEKITENPSEKPREISNLETINKTNILLNKLESEMKLGHRDVYVTEYGRFRIYLPDVKTDREISDIKIRLVSELLSHEDIITKEEIMDKLRARKLWDNKKEELEQTLTKDVIDLTKDIMYEQHQDEIDFVRLAELKNRKSELEKKRKELTETRDYFLSASLEMKVEIALFKHQMVLCMKQLIKNEDNTESEIPVWNSIEELENDKRKYLVNRISSSAGYFWNGWSEDLLFEALDM